MKEISISQIEGFSVGHAEDEAARTGCTAILTPAGAVASGFTPGFAPGSREMDLLKPESAPQAIHGLLLAGGSAFGLAAAQGVVEFLRERGHGLDVGPATVPLVPAAVIFDYPGNLSGGRLPDAAMGYRAAAAADQRPVLSGPHGAGISARSGKIAGHDLSSPSGLGSFGFRDGALAITALTVVNPLGSVVNPDNGRIISGARRPDGRLCGRREILKLLREQSALGEKQAQPRRGAALEAGHTVLAVVGLNARLTKLGAYRISRMAAAGLARAVYPAHLLYDGDTVFALSSNTGPEADESWLGALAADAVSRAIVNSVPAWR
ncbi:MAG: P1 family peptidase [Candidatus Adiutrix sp.]|jgi:L-aminopeptidase/D-esterase-like protein|nr:P1 family peptidase [Candidatus Adiutrix sp.]